MLKLSEYLIPNSVKFILSRLKQSGFEAYIVGGCVRDLLLGISPHDWDITTNALPHQTKKCFSDLQVIETGIKHGTVSILYNNETYEITTYRIDSSYSDNRHPDNVIFTGCLTKDLARRDFTINAIAADINGQIIDPFSGQKDIQDRTIRAVGNPDDRFQEDALRILRALRFASKLDFVIDNKTALSILKNCKLLENIANERIAKEFQDILCGKNAERILIKFRDVIAVFIPEIKVTFDFVQHNPYHIYNVFEHIVKSIQYANSDKIVKLAMFFHDIGKPECYSLDSRGIGHFYGHAQKSYNISEIVLKRLRFDNKTISQVSGLVKYNDLVLQPKSRFVLRMLNKIGEEQFRRLLEVHKADVAAQSVLGQIEQATLITDTYKILEQILIEQKAFNVKDLEINGRDLMELGFQQGPEIGKMLNKALEAVINGEPNSKEVLLDFCKNNI